MGKREQPELVVRAKEGGNGAVDLLLLMTVFLALGLVAFFLFKKTPLYFADPLLNLAAHLLVLVAAPIAISLHLSRQGMDLVLPKGSLVAEEKGFLKRARFDWWNAFITMAAPCLGLVLGGLFLIQALSGQVSVGPTGFWGGVKVFAWVLLVSLLLFQYLLYQSFVRVDERGMGFGLKHYVEWDGFDRVVMSGRKFLVYLKVCPSVYFGGALLSDADQVADLKERFEKNGVPVLGETRDATLWVEVLVVGVFSALCLAGWSLYQGGHGSMMGVLWSLFAAGIVAQLLFEYGRGIYRLTSSQTRVLPNPTVKLTQAQDLLSDLERVGYFEGLSQERKRQMIASILEEGNPYGAVPPLDGADQGALGDPRFERCVHADAEDLAEGGVEKVLERLRPTLERLGVRDWKVELVRFHANSYVLRVNGKEETLYGPEDTSNDGGRLWKLCARRTMEIVNDTLRGIGSPERLLGVGGGNDFRVLFLTREQFEVLRKTPVLSDPERPNHEFGGVFPD